MSRLGLDTHPGNGRGRATSFDAGQPELELSNVTLYCSCEVLTRGVKLDGHRHGHDVGVEPGSVSHLNGRTAHQRTPDMSRWDSIGGPNWTRTRTEKPA